MYHTGQYDVDAPYSTTEALSASQSVAKVKCLFQPVGTGLPRVCGAVS